MKIVSILALSLVNSLQATNNVTRPDPVDPTKLKVEKMVLTVSGTTDERFYRITDNENGIVCYSVTSSNTVTTLNGGGAGSGSAMQCLKK